VTLYRLVDPQTSRTIVYVRTNDAQMASLLGKFVGVKGNIVENSDMRITFITPTELQTVDPADVNVKIFGTFTPPSLVSNIAGESPSR
jgi:hypothetical protein